MVNFAPCWGTLLSTLIPFELWGFPLWLMEIHFPSMCEFLDLFHLLLLDVLFPFHTPALGITSYACADQYLAGDLRTVCRTPKFFLWSTFLHDTLPCELYSLYAFWTSSSVFSTKGISELWLGCLFLFCGFFFLERERVQVSEAQREREREREREKSGAHRSLCFTSSGVHVHPMWDLNSQTVRSWPEPKSDA